MSAGETESFGRKIVVEQLTKFRIVIYRKDVFYIGRLLFFICVSAVSILAHRTSRFALLYGLASNS
jgi:hypothetical protein